MKGYTVDVRGFSLEKKNLVNKAIGKLTGLKYCPDENVVDVADKITNIGPARGAYLVRVICGYGELTDMQTPHKISFNDLMLEAGFNYEERGVEGFGEIDIFKGVKITTNKTRPLITREQYDAVMAQSDKRTFTKALDDLLAIEKEQLLDESAIRIKQLEDKCARLFAGVTSWRESWERVHNEKKEAEGKLEKQKRISGVLSLLLISSVAALLAVIFLR